MSANQLMFREKSLINVMLLFMKLNQLMYDFHYNFIKKILMLNYYLLTQTVSLIKLNQKMFIKNFLNTNICLTLAILQKTPKFYDNQNEMIVGKMKDEYKRISIIKFVGLKSKMHYMISGDDKESNAAKEVNIATEFNEFKDTLFNKKVVRHKMKGIQSKKYKIGTYEINKISLSCFDDKKFVLDDDIHTVAYFHKDLKK